MAQETQKIFSNDRAYVGGIVNEDLLTPHNITQLGTVAGLVFRNGGDHRVLIGKDTRLPNYGIEAGLAQGFISVGIRVLYTGPIPRPAIAMLTSSMDCDLGVMIGSSEEGFEYGGIEIFGPALHPLSPDHLDRMQAMFYTDLTKKLSKGAGVGPAKRIETAQGRYIQYAKGTLPEGTSFRGLRVVLDCANGAAYEVAPEAFMELKAELFLINVAPDGLNINHECGTAAPRALKEKAHYHKADVSFAFDGTGSRLCLVDEKGTVVGHDELQAFFADKVWRDDPLVMALQIAAMVKEKGPASQIFTK